MERQVTLNPTECSDSISQYVANSRRLLHVHIVSTQACNEGFYFQDFTL